MAMVTTSKQMIVEITEIVQRLLRQSGLEKRTAQIFTRKLPGETLGWVGLNRAINRGDGKLEVNPVIGLRHQRLESLVAELIGLKDHPYIPPTISTPIGYLMPENSYVSWLFEPGENHSREAQRMVQSITTYGYPFMSANNTLASLIDKMLAGFGHPHQLKFRIPAAYLLVSETQMAEDCVNQELNALCGRDDAAADQYRAFAKAMFMQSVS